MRQRVRSFLVALGLGLLVLPAGAQNFISNPNFDTNDLSAWPNVISGLSIVWDSSDAFGGTGSAHVTNSTPGFNAGPYSACYVSSVTAGSQYDFGATIRVPSGQTGTGLAQFYVYWYSGTNCVGGYITATATPAAPATNVWTLSTLTSQTAPPGAQSVSFYLMTYNSGASGTFEAYWDRVFFGPVGTTPVSLQRAAAD